jgi:PAS domain S-box-containing protein
VAEARYRRLFEAAKDGIVIVHAETGEILDSNPYITTLFGYPRAQLLGTKYWESDLFRESEIQEDLLETMESSDLVHKSVRLPRLVGPPLDVDIVASPFTEGETRVVQFNIRDISARKRIEESARREEDQLRQAHKMEAVGRLAGGVAHDFNNLLTAVLGYCELLEQEVDESTPASGMVAQIRAAAERAALLTRQLLAFGRKQVLRPVAFPPDEVIGEMRQLLSVMMREGIELAFAGHSSGRVMMDRGQFEQVVMNLVLNARDAMPNGGRVTVETSDVEVDEAFSERHPTVPVGRYVAVSVRDTGIGMDEETKEHLFEPFFTTKPKGVGVGLGLSTVYEIVTKNRGCIQAYSELAVGSTFTVYLPRVAEQSGAEEAPPVRETAGGTETILLAEDEPAVRQLARKFLGTRGYHVLEAANGPEALRLSREYKGRIDLLLTDVIMPRMSGRELAFQLAGERPEMKVLYVSGHTEDAIVPHGVLGEGVAFLQKPFTQEALAARVRSVLEEKQ